MGYRLLVPPIGATEPDAVHTRGGHTPALEHSRRLRGNT